MPSFPSCVLACSSSTFCSGRCSGAAVVTSCTSPGLSGGGLFWVVSPGSRDSALPAAFFAPSSCRELRGSGSLAMAACGSESRSESGTPTFFTPTGSGRRARLLCKTRAHHAYARDSRTIGPICLPRWRIHPQGDGLENLDLRVLANISAFCGPLLVESSLRLTENRAAAQPNLLHSPEKANPAGRPLLSSAASADRQSQSRTTLPELPDFIASKPSSKRSTSKRWVKTGVTSSPLCSMAAILYQVSNISRP